MGALFRGICSGFCAVFMVMCAVLVLGHVLQTTGFFGNAEGCTCVGSSCPGVGEKGGENNADFDLPDKEVAKALVGKAVNVDGLLWNFLPGQDVNVRILEKRCVGSTASVAVSVSVETPIDAPPPPQNAGKGAEPKKAVEEKSGSGSNKVGTVSGDKPRPAGNDPTKAYLSGVARINFDLVAGTWYIIGIESLSLKISAK